MSGTGSVERILVGGILVVVLAILGIASWSATGSGDDVSPSVATDGGVTEGGASSRAGQPADSDAQRLADAQAKNEAALVRRQDLAARWLGASETEREALAKEVHGVAEGPRPVAPPEALGTAQPVAGAVDAAGVPLRSNGKPHTDDPTRVAPLGFGTLPQTVPGALVDPAPRPAAPRGAAAGPASHTPASHTVVEGDTLWGIVKRHYGEGDVQGMMDLVLQANPTVDADSIYVGQVLALPALSGATASALVTPSPEQQAQADDSVLLYEVREGDTLSAIASAELGSSGRWTEIYELNRRRLPSPDRVLPGMTLVLPRP